MLIKELRQHWLIGNTVTNRIRLLGWSSPDRVFHLGYYTS